jgi:hypothetical protein
MEKSVAREMYQLRKMTVPQLRERYAEVTGEATKSRHKDFLVRRIIWHMQANAMGGLSERARQRAMELAEDADVRLTAPKVPVEPQPNRTKVGKLETSHDDRLPLPGATLTREYKGDLIEVPVRDDGFAYAGTVYKTLSAVAKAITGTHWNGYHFFKLGKHGDAHGKTE